MTRAFATPWVWTKTARHVNLRKTAGKAQKRDYCYGMRVSGRNKY